MAFVALRNMFSLFTFAATFSILFNSCYGFYPKLLNASLAESDSDWSPAGATWYGSPTGAGSNGGACGYGGSVEQAPFSAMVSAGGPSLFKSGKGCGACYKVKCTTNSACSGNPVNIVISDSCPGCVGESVHFDLSGTAFSAMAKSGQAEQLRNAGQLQIQYRRVNCNNKGTKIAFRVDAGSNPYYFATVVEYVNGDGDLYSIELKQELDSDSWLSMEHSWGAVWSLQTGSRLRAPFSIKLTTLKSRESIVANGVIPVGWQPGQTYRSAVNFKA